MADQSTNPIDNDNKPDATLDLAYVNVAEATKECRCVICLADAEDPRLCPRCSHLFSFGCLQAAFRTNSRSCPLCRVRVTIGSYVRVPFVSDLLKTLRSAKAPPPTPPPPPPPPPPTADECAIHAGKYLSVYCRDCLKSICMDCWTCDHDGHSTSPIEVVNSRKRKLLEDEILPEIESRAKSLRDVIGRSLVARLDQYERLKREGDQRVEEVKRTMTEAWDRECRAQTDFAACFSNSLRELESTADQLKDAADDTRLNRLVDRLPARDGEIPFDIVMKLADVDSVQLADWPNQIKPMNVLHPWLPGWDVETRIDLHLFEECVVNPSPALVATFPFNDVDWNVWIGNRRHLGLVEEEAEAKVDWREDVVIFVTMTGRRRLRNYELSIEPVLSEDDVVIDGEERGRDDEEKNGANGQAEDVGLENDGVDGRREKNAKKDQGERCVIVRRSDFIEGDKLFFSGQKLKRWMESGDKLSLIFKVRPLTYEQKINDLKTYYERRLANEVSTFSFRDSTLDLNDLDEDLDDNLDQSRGSIFCASIVQPSDN